MTLHVVNMANRGGGGGGATSSSFSLRSWTCSEHPLQEIWDPHLYRPRSIADVINPPAGLIDWSAKNYGPMGVDVCTIGPMV